ncbi:MAG: GDSL-type esterase/lipase family protein, partial [Phycisphaeraceae bacterium JB051]
MKKLFALILSLTFVLTVFNPTHAADEPALKQGNVRLLFVGDSITGQSRNVRSGYAHQFEAAVKAVYPDSNPQIISLGGSGHSVGSWAGIEKKSRDKSVILDVKTIDVHEELAKPADVLVIMLGMNDVLAPYVAYSEPSMDKWVGRYQKLIDALKLRVSPKVLALASITPCTEVPYSPKNMLISQLNDRIAALAKQNNARLLPTSQTVWEIQTEGRTRASDFHVTADYVHPTTAGHIGIAMGMLKGLGESQAAKWLEDNRLTEVYQNIAKRGSAFAWDIQSGFHPQNRDQASYSITYHWLNPKGQTNVNPTITLTVPEGWQVSPSTLTTPTGRFTVFGKPDRLQNIVTLHANADGLQQRSDIFIPAPWLVGYSFVQRLWKQPGYQFMTDKAHTPIDDVIEAGGDFTKSIDLGNGQTLTWLDYTPSINFTGGTNPASVDFAAMLHANN